MTFDLAQQIVLEIESEIGGENGLSSLFNDLIKAAVKYARYRTDCEISKLDSKGELSDVRMELDQRRTIAHDAFIDSINILCRNMDQKGKGTRWRGAIGNDRKVIGDFACHVHDILGLKAK